jgi:iron complex transport system substrate-binding protein
MAERLQPRHLVRWLGSLAFACLAFGVQAQTPVTDDQGTTITLSAAPKRIVSLLPNITEMVCELQACDRLVGVDRHSNHPPGVRALPSLGGLDDTPLERLLQLKPDLVLLAGSTRLLPRLRQLGLPVMVFEPHNQADTERMGRALSLLLTGNDGAWLAYQHRQQQAWSDLNRQLPPGRKGQTVYIEVGDGPYVAAQTSFIGQALQRVGLLAAVPGDWGVFPRLSPEWVLRAQPDWVVLPASATPAASRPAWAGLHAVQQGQVCVLKPPQMDALVRPGPRLSEGISAILTCMQARAAQS